MSFWWLVSGKKIAHTYEHKLNMVASMVQWGLLKQSYWLVVSSLLSWRLTLSYFSHSSAGLSAATTAIMMLLFPIIFYRVWASEAYSQNELMRHQWGERSATVIMLTLRGSHSVGWLNQFLLYSRGLDLASGKQTRPGVVTYVTLLTPRLCHQVW